MCTPLYSHGKINHIIQSSISYVHSTKNNATMRNHLLAPNLEKRASDEAVVKRALEMDKAVFYKIFTLSTKWSSAARFYPSEHVSFPPNGASRILLTNCKPLLTTSATWILGVDVCGVNTELLIHFWQFINCSLYPLFTSHSTFHG